MSLHSHFLFVAAYQPPQVKRPLCEQCNKELSEKFLLVKGKVGGRDLARGLTADLSRIICP